MAAVDSDELAAFNGAYAQSWHPDFDRIDDPTYLLTQVELAIGGKVIALGSGTATAVRGRTVVGVRAGQSPWGPTCVKRRFASATRWSDGKVQSYGSGVAYAVNDSGQAVGDDERYFGDAGKPTLWRGGRAYTLDDRQGSAYAIADDGTVVGQIDLGGFIGNSRRPHDRIELIDKHLRDKRWHVIAAYDISKGGAILCVATFLNRAPQVTILTKE